jgi:RNA polymerase sigma-70 factor (ECF subfamily)
MKRQSDMEFAAFRDEDLALALQAGRVEALDELVRRHQGRVYAVAYRITGNREDALDVAQEAFIKAYRKAQAWQPIGGFLPWLLRLTANQAIDAVRRRKRRPSEALDEQHPVVGGPGVEERVLAGEAGARVEQALEVLSPAQRAVFVMRHYEGMPLADIAQVLGCTVGSVKVHLFRSLKKLQVELRDLYETK